MCHNYWSLRAAMKTQHNQINKCEGKKNKKLLWRRWASLVTQTVKNLPALQENQVRSLGWEVSSGEGNGYSLQYSCLENSMDRGTWWDTVHGVSKCFLQYQGAQKPPGSLVKRQTLIQWVRLRWKIKQSQVMVKLFICRPHFVYQVSWTHIPNPWSLTWSSRHPKSAYGGSQATSNIFKCPVQFLSSNILSEGV